MSIHTFVVALLIGGAVSNDAFAKGKETAEAAAPAAIEHTGIAAFDDVFSKVKAIHDELDHAQHGLHDANDGIATALGLATGTPIKDAIADLQHKAEGKLHVAMEGTKPHLAPSDAVPENVQAGIDAVNKTIDACQATIEALATMPDKVKALVAEAQALPPKVPTAVQESGMKVTEVPKVTKAVNNNVKATTQTTARVDALIAEAKGTIDLVASTFPKKE